MMEHFKTIYQSPIGEITICGNSSYITELFFSDSKDECEYEEKELSIFAEAKKWLDNYFKGIDQKEVPAYKLEGISSFQRDVLEETLKIGYGKTRTYGDIANVIAKKRNIKKMSSQAVGHALNKNPICLIIPCHRVIGKNSNLVGYGGGIERKRYLLELEGHSFNN